MQQAFRSLTFSLSLSLSLLTVLCALLFYSFSLSLSFASIATYFLKRGKVIGRAQPQQQRTEQKRAEQTNKGTKVKQKNRLRRCYDNIKNRPNVQLNKYHNIVQTDYIPIGMILK